MKSARLLPRCLVLVSMLSAGAACSSKNSKGSSGGGAAGTGRMPSNDMGGSAPTGGSAGTSAGTTAGDGAGGAAGMAGAAEPDDAGVVDETSVEDVAPPIEEEAGPPVPRGAGVVYSFDNDSDLTVCLPNIPVAPCWAASVITDAGGAAGTIEPVTDEAVADHSPPRALQWTADYGAYDERVRITAAFARNEDWTLASRLHFTLKVASGFSSLYSYELFVQGGVATGYGSIYQPSLAENLAPLEPEAGGTFHDLSIDLTNPAIDPNVLLGVAGLGVVLRSVPQPSTDVPLPLPPPTVLVIDNIWLE